MARLTYQPLGAQEIVRVEGTDYGQGLALGRATADLIHENVARKKKLLDDLGEEDTAEFWRLVNENEAFMRETEPDLFEELAGMAEGSGVPINDLYMLNLYWFIPARNIAMECSCFYARGSATVDGKTYLAKTRDMPPEAHVVVDRRYPSGLQVLEVMAAGTPAFPPAGLNSSGFAVVSSGVWSEYSGADLSRGTSAFVMVDLRYLLRRAHSVDQAADLIRQSQYVAGINLTAVDRQRGATIEVTRDSVYVTNPGDTGVLTNHYVTESLRPLSLPRSESKSTYARYDRLQELLARHRGELSFKEMLSFLQDHQDGPQSSVCRHAVPADRDGGRHDLAFGHAKPSELKSQVGLVIVVEDGELWATLVNPCEAIKRVTLE